MKNTKVRLPLPSWQKTGWSLFGACECQTSWKKCYLKGFRYQPGNLCLRTRSLCYKTQKKKEAKHLDNTQDLKQKISYNGKTYR